MSSIIGGSKKSQEVIKNQDLFQMGIGGLEDDEKPRVPFLFYPNDKLKVLGWDII